MTAIVVFRCCAPSQSWGAVGNAADERVTSTHPLQSSITGLIAAALGAERGDTGTVEAINSGTMAFRIDRQGLIEDDYQTIADTISAEGNDRGTIISKRGELQDACITVFCAWADRHFAFAVQRALIHPHWPLHLGRRCHLVGAFPEAALDEAALDDTLIGSWPPCPVHPPRGDTWTVVADTTDPINAEGVTMTGARATDFRDRNHTVAAVRTYHIERLPSVQAEPVDQTITVDGTGTVIVDQAEIA